MGDLLVGHAEENAEEFRNFKTLVLSPDVVSGLLSLLEVLGGDWQELRAACSVWKIPRKARTRSERGDAEKQVPTESGEHATACALSCFVTPCV